jgi:hypothetical protein
MMAQNTDSTTDKVLNLATHQEIEGALNHWANRSWEPVFIRRQEIRSRYRTFSSCAGLPESYKLRN